MAVLVNTVVGSGPFAVTRNTLSANDTITYIPGNGQILQIYNATAGSLTVVVKGSLASATYPVAGSGGTTIDATVGKSIVIAAGLTYALNLDSLPAYLLGVITITGGTAATATILTN